MNILLDSLKNTLSKLGLEFLTKYKLGSLNFKSITHSQVLKFEYKTKTNKQIQISDGHSGS
jgi:hypothetical protein